MGFKYQLGKCCGCKTDTGKCNDNCTPRILTEIFPIDDWPCNFVYNEREKPLSSSFVFTKKDFKANSVIGEPIKGFDLSDDFTYEVLANTLTSSANNTFDSLSYYFIGSKTLHNFIATGDKTKYSIVYGLVFNNSSKKWIFSHSADFDYAGFSNDFFADRIICFIPCVLFINQYNADIYPRLKIENYAFNKKGEWELSYTAKVVITPGLNSEGKPAFYEEIGNGRLIFPELKVLSVTANNAGINVTGFEKLNDENCLASSFDFFRLSNPKITPTKGSNNTFLYKLISPTHNIFLNESNFDLVYTDKNVLNDPYKQHPIGLSAFLCYYNEQENTMTQTDQFESNASQIRFEIKNEIDATISSKIEYKAQNFHERIINMIRLTCNKATFDPKDKFELFFKINDIQQIMPFDRVTTSSEINLNLPAINQTLLPINKVFYKGIDLSQNITCHIAASPLKHTYSSGVISNLLEGKINDLPSFIRPVKATFKFKDIELPNDIVINGERYHFLRENFGVKTYFKFTLYQYNSNRGAFTFPNLNNARIIQNNETIDGYGIFKPGSHIKTYNLAAFFLGLFERYGFTFSQEVIQLRQAIRFFNNFAILKEEGEQFETSSSFTLTANYNYKYDYISKEVYQRKNGKGEVYDVPFGKPDIDQPT